MQLGNVVSNLKSTKLPSISKEGQGSDDDEDTVIDPATGRRLIKKDPNFILHVHVAQTKQTIKINCGRAKQKVSWLAMAAAQRTMLQQPHGRNRQRENIHVNGGLILPGDLKDSSGRTVNPNMEIRKAFSKNDHITMSLGAKLTMSQRPTMPVGERGRPNMSRFTKLAYPAEPTSRQEASKVKNDKYVDIVDKNFEQSALARKMALKTNTYRKKHNHNETLAAQFRLVMRNQGLFENAFGLMTEQERLQELDAIIGDEWSQMKFNDIEGKPEEEENCKIIVMNNIGPLSDMFRYYCGLSRTSSLSTMSFGDFESFVGKAKIEGIDRSKLTEIFQQVNQEEHGQDVENVNPDDEMLRYEFFEMLIRLGVEVSRMSKTGQGVPTTSESLQHLLTNYVLKPEVMQGSSAQGGTCKVRAGLKEHAVQAMFQQKFEKLYTVFKRYAGVFEEQKPSKSKARQRQMSASAQIIAADTEMLDQKEHHQALHLEDFLKLLRDCALITEYRSQEHMQTTLKQKELEKEEAERKRKALHNQYRGEQLAAAQGAAQQEEEPGTPGLPPDEAQEAPVEPPPEAVKLPPIGLPSAAPPWPPEEETPTKVASQAVSLTMTEARLAFSLSQADTDVSVADLEDMSFPEFLESVARLALMKWPDETEDGTVIPCRLPFREKVKLALDCIMCLHNDPVHQSKTGSSKPKKASSPRKRRARKASNEKESLGRKAENA